MEGMQCAGDSRDLEARRACELQASQLAEIARWIMREEQAENSPLLLTDTTLDSISVG